MENIVSLKNVSKTFPVGKSLLGKPTKFVHAVNNVSFDVYEGRSEERRVGKECRL